MNINMEEVTSAFASEMVPFATALYDVTSMILVPAGGKILAARDAAANEKVTKRANFIL
jgi:hypothetical protein